MPHDLAASREALLFAVQSALDSSPESVAVMRIDLDRFVRIGQTFGAGTSRIVLTRLVSRIESIVGDTSRLLEYGPDSFIAVVDVASSSDESLDALAMDAMTAISEPMDIGGERIAVGCSIGIACGAEVPGRDALRLLAAAEIAVQRANALGSRRAVVYRRPHDSDPTRFPHLFADMLGALERQEFTPYFQPIMRMTDLTIEGAEAVARWLHPDHGLLLPAEFLGEAESSGLIRGIDQSIRRQAIACAASWPHPGLGVTVNLSGADLDSPDLVDDVASSLQESRLSPDLVILEITETTLAQDWPRALARLRDLRELGVFLAIDDFGTGHMYLDRLTSGVFDFLKIDRSLVAHGITEGWRADALLRGVTDLAHDQGIRVIAEGVETPEHLERVTTAGCDYAQGFFFGSPIPDSEFLKSLGF